MPKLTNIAKLKDCFCSLYGMIRRKSLLILMQSYHFTTDFYRVLMQLVNILNIKQEAF